MHQLSMAHLLGLLFLACLGSSHAQTLVEVVAGSRLELQCAAGAGAQAEWRRDGAALSAHELRALGLASGERAEPLGVVLTLSAERAAAPHAGRWSCGGAGPPTDLVVLAAARGEAGAGPVAAAGSSEAGPGLGVGAGPGPGPGVGVVYFEVGQAHVELTCALSARAPDTPLHWSKNGTAVGGGAAAAAAGATDRWLAVGGILRLEGRAHEEDYGNYTCTDEKDGASQVVSLVARPLAKLPANTNVVEGQKLKLSCKLVGRPYQRVTWLYANASAPDGDLGRDAVVALTELGASPRLQPSEQGAEDGELVVDAATKSLAGRYTCRAGVNNRNATTTLRVKDMYAALWPFLGIVLEVLILCSVIAVYERRRTKPDLADSDTDTPNQKKS